MLSTERIVGAAIAVADREGLGALSMRRVAVELDVATMSLYRHVRDKDDLLIRMMDAAFAEWQVPPPQSGDSWQETVAVAARRLWQLFRRHLWQSKCRLSRQCLLIKTCRHSEQSWIHSCRTASIWTSTSFSRLGSAICWTALIGN
ncbi:MAG TPA: helix-turn-helix domain-containing protein [Propionibacteriaceae bacterium]|nr:helix-turn-helix domain-containing protein [Propionibacteriaceae bacterium]